jgi:putative lipoic acid-binding regulatory protein
VSVDPPKIVFPCAYPIKVLGRASDTFRDTVLSIFEHHAPGFSREDVVIKDSNKGTFQSITVTIEAQSEAQLRLLHQDLMGTGLVSMVI